MKKVQKIVLLWAVALVIHGLMYIFLPHSEIDLANNLNKAVQLLLFMLSISVFMNEPTKKNKYIFLNFAFGFSFCVLQFFFDGFIGYAFLGSYRYSSFLFTQYNIIGFELALSIAIVYLVIDLMFRDISIVVKYLSTFAIVLVFFVYYFHSFLYDPLFLYSTEDIKQWKTIDAFVESKEIQGNSELPTAIELSNEIKLQSWRNGIPVGDLYPEENLRRIEQLAPYLAGENWQVLFYKPLYLDIISMNVMLIGFIALFFGYQYKKDPPQGAYIDKIMFLFLLLSSMEILHNWGFIRSLEWTSYNSMATIGQYITFFIELLIVLFFSLRLRFVTSVQGEFYETELASNPQQVTRWRDWVDEFVLAQFFNFKLFNGRLFQDTSAK